MLNWLTKGTLFDADGHSSWLAVSDILEFELLHVTTRVSLMSRRIRVMTIVNNLSLGGAEVALFRLLSHTKDEFQHLVIPLLFSGPLIDSLKNIGIEVLDIGVRGWTTAPRAFFKIKQAMGLYHPDIISAHMYHSAVTSAALGYLFTSGTPVLWTIHHSLNGFNREKRSTRVAIELSYYMSNVPVAITYVSKRSKDQHVARGFPNATSRIIRNGQDIERFRFDQVARDILRKEWGVPNNACVVGHVAHVSPMKDHRNLFFAVEYVLDKFPALQVVLCGTGTDKLPLPTTLAPYVRRLGLRTDMPEIMSACDIGCLTSAYGEALPNVLAEFMACERPCVTTDVGDSAELVSDYGKVVPPRHPESLGEAILELARLSADERAAIGLAARNSIVHRFDITQVSDQYRQLWRAVAREGWTSLG